jgi:hypothetical protein
MAKNHRTSTLRAAPELVARNEARLELSHEFPKQESRCAEGIRYFYLSRANRR